MNDDMERLNMLREISVNYMIPGSAKGFRRRCAPCALEPFDEFPLGDEIIKKIFNSVSLRDLGNLMRVSKKFYRVAKSLNAWKRIIIKKTCMDIGSFHALLSRGVKELEMRAPSSVRLPTLLSVGEDFQVLSRVCVIYSVVTLKLQDYYENLVHLDLGTVIYDNRSCLLSVLQRTCKLKILNIANYPYLDAEHCMAISQNKNLAILNIEQCSGLTLDGLALLCQCDELIEMNAAWTQFPSGGAAVMCKMIPAGILRLSLAGRIQSELPDLLLELLLNRCPHMSELDVSDCPDITEELIPSFNEHPSLNVLSVCRCYNISPQALLKLNKVDVLNVYGCVTDDGIPMIKERLRGTIVNQSPLSDIAQPSLKPVSKE